MKKLVATLALLASCEPFTQENDMEGDARESFEHWRDMVVTGKMAESAQMLTWSYKSQWLFDLLKAGDYAALSWKAKLQGNTRTDLDLWFPEAEKDYQGARGRVPTVPRTVAAEPSLTPLFVAILQEAAVEIRYELKKVQIVRVASDERGVSVLIHNSHGEPEMYAMVIEGGTWKLDHHATKGRR